MVKLFLQEGKFVVGGLFVYVVLMLFFIRVAAVCRPPIKGMNLVGIPGVCILSRGVKGRRTEARLSPVDP